MFVKKRIDTLDGLIIRGWGGWGFTSGIISSLANEWAYIQGGGA